MSKLWSKLGGVLGIAYCIVGFFLIFLGWNGAASNDREPAQIPYLISGGIGGLALVVLGSALIVAHSLRADRVELRGAIEDLRGAEGCRPADQQASRRVAGRPSRRDRRQLGALDGREELTASIPVPRRRARLGWSPGRGRNGGGRMRRFFGPKVRRSAVVVAGLAISISLLPASAAAAPAGVRPAAPPVLSQQIGEQQSRLLLFAADGLMQDRVKAYAADRDVVPGFRELLRRGAVAAGGGLLTQSPAEHRRRLEHADAPAPGRGPRARPTTRSTSTASRSPTAPSAFDAGRPPGRDAGPGRRAGRSARRPDRVGRWSRRRHRRPDARLPQLPLRPGRGHQLHRPDGRRRVHRRVRAPVRPPGRLRRAGAVPGRRSRGRHRLDRRAGLVQPGAGDAAAGPRRRHGQVRPQRLPLRQHRRRRDELRPRAALAGKSGADAERVGDLAAGEWADVKVTVQGTDTLNGKTAAFLAKIERLAPDLSEVRLFHTSVTRAIATWPSWPGEPGFTGDFEDYVAATFPSSQAGDFAILEAGIVSEETYVEQGLYWETELPPADRVRPRHLPAGPGDGGLPRHRRVPAPVPRPRHADAAQRRGQPGLRRRPGQRHARQPGRRAGGLHPAGLPGRRRHHAPGPGADGRSRPDDLRGVRPRLRARSSRRSTPARSSSTSASSRSRRRRTAVRRPARPSARPRPAGPAARCRSTSTWPGAIRGRRTPAGAAADEDGPPSPRSRRPSWPSPIPNDWTGDGAPEGWPVIDRAFSKAEARAIPNGPGTHGRHGPPDADR